MIAKRRIKEIIKHLVEEFDLFARKEDIKFLEKYINLWNPIKFVTSEELKNALEEHTKNKIKKDGDK